MAGLVGYASSDEEDEQQSMTIVSEPSSDVSSKPQHQLTITRSPRNQQTAEHKAERARVSILAQV